MRKQLLITGLCCGLALAPIPAVLAQTSDQSTDHQRIEALEARVAALEQRLGAPSTMSQPPSGQPTPATTAPATVTPAPTTVASTKPAPAAVSPPPAAGDWSQLHTGMDAREVTAELGPPDHKQVRPTSEIWFYPSDRQVQFDRNSRLESWSRP